MNDIQGASLNGLLVNAVLHSAKLDRRYVRGTPAYGQGEYRRKAKPRACTDWIDGTYYLVYGEFRAALDSLRSVVGPGKLSGQLHDIDHVFHIAETNVVGMRDGVEVHSFMAFSLSTPALTEISGQAPRPVRGLRNLEDRLLPIDLAKPLIGSIELPFRQRIDQVVITSGRRSRRSFDRDRASNRRWALPLGVKHAALGNILVVNGYAQMAQSTTLCDDMFLNGMLDGLVVALHVARWSSFEMQFGMVRMGFIACTVDNLGLGGLPEAMAPSVSATHVTLDVPGALWTSR